MHNHEIEKLAKEYAEKIFPILTKAYEETFFGLYPNGIRLNLSNAFQSGYLKGVETERKRCLEICESSIKIHVYINNLVEESRFIKELIERGDK